MRHYDRLLADEGFRADALSDTRHSELAIKYEAPETTLRRARKAVRAGKWVSTANPTPEASGAPQGPPSESHDRSGDKWVATARTSERITSLEQLLAFFEVDTAEWSVESWKANKWEVGTKNPDSSVEVTALYQISATFRKKAHQAALNEIAALIEEAKAHAPIYHPITYPTFVEGHLLEVSMPDLHVGKLAWDEECGEDYDTAIAQRVFAAAMSSLLHRSSVYPIERICYVLGNDLLNADDLENRTTRGTPQTTDGRQHRTFRKVRQMMVEAIETLVQIAPVDVIMCPGNHDRMSTFYLGDALQCWFNRHPSVNIDNRASLRKYYEYGDNMLMFTHGSEEKRDRLGQIAAAEQPEMWGRTRFREAHVGHFHFAKLDEVNGFRVRMLPSLCGAEDWHVSKGFTMAIRSAETLIWSKSDGLVGQHVYNLPRGPH